MEFTKKLFLATKEKHLILDKHAFVKCILNGNTIAFNNYIQFHYIVFYQIQKELDKYILPDFFKELYREIPLINMDMDIDYIISTLNLQDLLVYVYMFYLGILKGGNILRKHYPNHESTLFYFKNKELLISELKEYLNKTIVDENKFINSVNDNYTIINKIFNKILTNMDDSL